MATLAIAMLACGNQSAVIANVAGPPVWPQTATGEFDPWASLTVGASFLLENDAGAVRATIVSITPTASGRRLDIEWASAETIWPTEVVIGATTIAMELEDIATIGEDGQEIRRPTIWPRLPSWSSQVPRRYSDAIARWVTWNSGVICYGERFAVPPDSETSPRYFLADTSCSTCTTEICLDAVGIYSVQYWDHIPGKFVRDAR